MPEPRPRRTALRLFVTCWLVYSFHVATNMVRENYLALAIGDHLTFRVDEYAGMHDDIFEHPGYGWHIGSNPGASMLAAIPYAVARPVIDPIVTSVRERRAAGGDIEPPAYDAPTETDRRFFEEAWRRGFDVKFGLASIVMQSLAMATTSALGVVAMYVLLCGWLRNSRRALWLALLYAFGTPLFLRSGLLNHNMMMGTVALVGFGLLWNPSGRPRPSSAGRVALAGLACGLAVLLDYSGVIVAAALAGFARWQVRHEISWPRTVGLLTLGALGPLLLLWFYQWRSFGHPFLPPQHWMPPVEYIEVGYQGLGVPSLEIARSLALDLRYGLFVSCPLFVLALAAPFVNRRAADGRASLPTPVLVCCAAISVGLFVFFGGVQYTRWQFNSGVRYLAPAFPFLFLLACVTLLRLRRPLQIAIGLASVAFAWMLAMARDVSGGKVDLADPDAGLGVLDPVVRVLTEGPQLPALTTLSRMEGYGILSSGSLHPLVAFAVLGALLYLVWRPRSGERP